MPTWLEATPVKFNSAALLSTCRHTVFIISLSFYNQYICGFVFVFTYQSTDQQYSWTLDTSLRKINNNDNDDDENNDNLNEDIGVENL